MHYVLHGGPAGPTRTPRSPCGSRRSPLLRRRPLPAAPARAAGRGLAGASDAELLRHYVAEGWRARVGPRPDFDPAGYVQARSGSRAVADDPFFRYVAENPALRGRAVRGAAPAEPAGGGRGLVPGDLPGRGRARAVPALRRGGLAGAARSRPGRSTLAALLRVCGLRPARAPVEDTGWLGAIGRRPSTGRAPGPAARLVAGISTTASTGRATGCPRRRTRCATIATPAGRRAAIPDPTSTAGIPQRTTPPRRRRASRPSSHHLARALLRGEDLAGDVFDPRYGAPPAEEDAGPVRAGPPDRAVLRRALVPQALPGHPAASRTGRRSTSCPTARRRNRDPSKTFSTRFYRRPTAICWVPGSRRSCTTCAPAGRRADGLP